MFSGPALGSPQPVGVEEFFSKMAVGFDSLTRFAEPSSHTNKNGAECHISVTI